MSNLELLTLPENSIIPPPEPVEYNEQEQEKQIIDDKSRCKYVSTKGKNVGKVCGSILASKLYYEIRLCKKHQTIINMRNKAAEKKANKESKSKQKERLIVQSPALKAKQKQSKTLVHQ
jgi:hypothetical protein